MPAAPSPAFQFYANDFLSLIADLEAEEVGVLIALIASDWARDGLPNSPEKLARICRVSSRKFSRIWQTIATHFENCDDGKLRSAITQRERAKQLRYSEAMSENGKKGGRPEKPRLSGEKADEKPRKSSSFSSSTSVKEIDQSDAVLAHFVAVHPRRRTSAKDAKIVRRAFGFGYSASDLCAAIDGNARDEWHRAHHKHELAYVLRDTGLIDGFIAKALPAEQPPLIDEFGCFTAYGERVTRPAVWQ